MSWPVVLWIAAAGALGSVARWLLAQAVTQSCGAGFPVGTFAVNLLGCLLFGVCMGIAGEGWSQPLRAAVFTGFFGGFTTFSSFAFECSELLVAGRTGTFALNVLGQNALGIGGMWLGLTLGRLILGRSL
jgi:fluoride exporter